MRLRSQLLRWLLVPTLALWAVAVVFGYLRSLEQAHEAYDRTLLGAAMVLAERIAADGDELVADVPHAALEMLRTDAHDRVYYRVADWPGTRHVTGYPELAPPQEPPGDEPVVYDAEVRGEPVRVAALRSSAVTPQGPRPLLVLVAETMEARRQLTRRLAVDSAVVQLLLIVAAAALITLGVRLGLAPLRRLRDEVRDRSPNDLTPIDTRGVPREVAPLIEAINLHTQRQRELGEVQARFVANASHQLKTPLTVLRAQIDHALRQRSQEETQAVLRQISDATASTQRLVTQLLSLARSEASRDDPRQRTDLAATARDVCMDLVILARQQGVDLGYDGEEGPVNVTSDPVLLREAVANLVHNAIAYTPRGGAVTVRVESEGVVARIDVDDTGPGIPAPERAQVLERFYRRPGSGGSGSGLGLSIVLDICQRHGAWLHLLDGPGGRGLRARMEWPAT